MSLGVRAKLVDLKSGEFMWAIDETFDAGHAGVILGASVFQEKGSSSGSFGKNWQRIAFAPSFFEITSFHYILDLADALAMNRFAFIWFLAQIKLN